MDKSVTKYFTIAVFIAVLAGFFILNRVIVPPAILESERRPPADSPAITWKNFSSDSFMTDFDEWAQDSFALRENLRALRAHMVFNVFRQTDKEGLYTGDSGAGKIQKIDEAAWQQTIAKVNRMEERIRERDSNIYMAVIPDKSLYAGRYLPGYDAETARKIIEEELSPIIAAIDLTEALAAGDFYKTDLHWSQPMTGGVMAALGEAMGFEYEQLSTDHIVNTAGEFKGGYAGQVALPMDEEKMEYVLNKYIDSSDAFYLDPGTAAMRPGKVYYPEALAGGGDPYDFFLNGPQPVIVLETPQKDSGRTLYLFRDSFGSSLAPLFLGAYDKVVLIDLRYIDSRVLTEYVDFGSGQDVLFIYSSQILGSPGSLLVS